MTDADRLLALGFTPDVNAPRWYRGRAFNRLYLRRAPVLHGSGWELSVANAKTSMEVPLGEAHFLDRLRTEHQLLRPLPQKSPLTRFRGAPLFAFHAFAILVLIGLVLCDYLPPIFSFGIGVITVAYLFAESTISRLVDQYRRDVEDWANHTRRDFGCSETRAHRPLPDSQKAISYLPGFLETLEREIAVARAFYGPWGPAVAGEYPTVAELLAEARKETATVEKELLEKAIADNSLARLEGIVDDVAFVLAGGTPRIGGKG